MNLIDSYLVVFLTLLMFLGTTINIYDSYIVLTHEFLIFISASAVITFLVAMIVLSPDHD